MAITAPPIRISQFAADPGLLDTPLWPKQQEILEEFWQGDYAIAVWALGRRSGKTLMAAVTATYAATMLAGEYRKHLRPGERFHVVSISNTIDQSRIALQGVKDLISGSPILKPLITRETSDTLELSNGAVFKALPASSRSGRGMACPLLIFDELAHALDTDGNAAGGSLYQALSPSVAQFGSFINYDRGPLPPLPNFQGMYYLSLDPAKGGRDDYTACIIHLDGDRLVLDKWHEFKPSWQDGKKTQVAIAEVEDWILEHHELYGFALVVLDQYNSQSTIQRLRGQVPIEELTWTAPTKTKAFSKLRELFNAQTIELYPHPKGIQQLKNLIVQYRANGTWNVTGGTGAAVDDYALALAGAVLVAQDSDPSAWLSIYSMSD